MEVFVAKYDYEKEREDILSFKEGEKFRIASKADKRWWAAYSESGDYGYVPSGYLEPFVDPLEGELAQKLSKSNYGDRKKVTLEELKRTVPQAPASSSNILNECDSSDSDDSSASGSGVKSNETVIIKPLSEVLQLPEDYEQLEPKKLHNPVIESKVHMKLHKELKLNNARGGAQQRLGKSELEKVMQRRKADADGKPGPIKSNKAVSSTSTCDGELAQQLARRTQLLDEAEKEVNIEKSKPEFMKVSLRKTVQSQTC